MEHVSCNEVNDLIANCKHIIAVYAYTPFCGTCQLAENMINEGRPLQHTLPIYLINLNVAPAFAKKWRILSVPCLLFFENGVELQRIYAFHSYAYVKKVLHIYEQLHLKKGD